MIKRCKTRTGKVIEVEVSPGATRSFGFLPGDRVRVPKSMAAKHAGKIAIVVGVASFPDPYSNGNHAPQLWFQIRGEQGISVWPGFNRERFEQFGFERISTERIASPVLKKRRRTKKRIN